MDNPHTQTHTATAAEAASESGVANPKHRGRPRPGGRDGHDNVDTPTYETLPMAPGSK